jgi:hypothetical protein
MAKGTINLHGHSHGQLKPLTRQFDVGVDVRDFQPITLAALMEGMDKCRLQRAACHLVRFKTPEAQVTAVDAHGIRNAIAQRGARPSFPPPPRALSGQCICLHLHYRGYYN